VSVSEASEFSSEEIDALLARARSWEPMLTGSRRDLDQCVPIAAELTLRLPRGALPSIAVKRPDRFARWQERLLEAGYVIRDLDLDQLPPEDNRPWVAGIRIDERSDRGGDARTRARHDRPARDLQAATVRGHHRRVEDRAQVTLRGRIGAALAVDPDAELHYTYTRISTSTNTLRLPLIAHHATGRRTACSTAGCSPLHWKAP